MKASPHRLARLHLALKAAPGLEPDEDGPLGTIPAVPRPGLPPHPPAPGRATGAPRICDPAGRVAILAGQASHSYATAVPSDLFRDWHACCYARAREAARVRAGARTVPLAEFSLLHGSCYARAGTPERAPARVKSKIARLFLIASMC